MWCARTVHRYMLISSHSTVSLTILQSAGFTVKRKFMKRLQLARAPPILCLHLKQSVWLSSGNLHKSAVSVAFPVHLDLSAIVNTRSVVYPAVDHRH